MSRINKINKKFEDQKKTLFGCNRPNEAGDGFRQEVVFRNALFLKKKML